MSKPLTVVSIITIIPGKEKVVREAHIKLVEETLKEPGCLRYELHQSLEDSCIFTVIAAWTNEEAWREHRRSPAILRYEAEGNMDLIKDLSFHRLTPLAGCTL